MSNPTRPRFVPSPPSPPTHRAAGSPTLLRSSRNRLGGLFLTVVTGLLASTLAAAREPAVRELNVRAVGSFDHISVGSDDVFNSSGLLVHLSEEESDIGSIVGVVTVPIGETLGARGFFGAVGSKRHIDVLPARRSGGIEMGGDLFWRDPEVGEIGIGPRYFWNQTTALGEDQSSHSGGAELSASLFIESFGVGPVDLDFVTSVLDSELDPDRNGSYRPGRTYAAAGGATVYLSDNFSAGLGGSWTRENAGNGEHHIVTSADIDAEVLLPFSPAVTLGAGLSFGEQEFSLSNFSTYGVSFWSIGVSVGVSFPGANSLVELNRFFY